MGGSGAELRRRDREVGEPISRDIVAVIAVRGLELTTDALFNLSDDYEALRAEIDALRLLISELTQRVAALETKDRESETA